MTKYDVLSLVVLMWLLTVGYCTCTEPTPETSKVLDTGLPLLLRRKPHVAEAQFQEKAC